jgi:hypothetical protein
MAGGIPMAMHAYRLNHYEELGIARDADAEAIRTAYRTLAKQLHPDLSDGDGRESKEAFFRVQEAYDVLRDPQRRARYDHELSHRTATAQAARLAAQRRARRRATPVPPLVPGRPPARGLGLGGYLAALGLVVIVAGGIVAWQLYFRPEPQPIIIVKVDPDARSRAARGSAPATPELPADPGILTKEVDRIVQAQVERVEAAKKRLETQLSELEAHKPAPKTDLPREVPTLLVSRVECIGRGTNIVLSRENGVARISYDNGPVMEPRIRDLGTGSVLVSRIEPTNKIAIAFTKGDRTGTTLLMFDQAGSVQQTFNVECTVAAF